MPEEAAAEDFTVLEESAAREAAAAAEARLTKAVSHTRGWRGIVDKTEKVQR